MTISSFELRVVRNERTTRIAPCGELDLATAPQLEQAITDATTSAVAELVLDLRELTFMDSTGLRTLAQANVQAGKAGTALSIWRGPRQIERVLEISGLGTLLPLADPPPPPA
ncbi:MAG: STAS domain-containing protein [Solirubrobacteraceae bacterium]|nr:STAS domain-containing protein [Solirubrobacteraceae bacterium]